jgi:hypothetical protein
MSARMYNRVILMISFILDFNKKLYAFIRDLYFTSSKRMIYLMFHSNLS